MKHESDSKPQFTIEPMSSLDVEAATEKRLLSWLDTYVNEELGVTREWIEARNEMQRSPEKVASRSQRFTEGKKWGTFNAWVAIDSNGEIIGSTTPFIDDKGFQHVGSIYVDKTWLGTGVGSQLMQKVVDWFDATKPIELMVATYNERAKSFYRKWGFVEVAGTEQLYEDKLPEIRMVRLPSNNKGARQNISRRER